MGGLNIGQGPFLTITFNASTEPDPSKIGWIARLPLQVVLCKEVFSFKQGIKNGLNGGFLEIWAVGSPVAILSVVFLIE